LTDESSNQVDTGSKSDGPVLVAVDFTPDSGAALLWACDYARLSGAPVLALHVVHDPGDDPGRYKTKKQDQMRPIEEVAADMMQEFLDKHRAERPGDEVLQAVQPVLVPGVPATRILEIAASRHARQIVMGSRGRTGLPHLLLGSKAERVVQLSPVPVTIVKAKKTAE